MSPIGTTIPTSCGPSDSSCCRSLAPISTSSVREIMPSGDCSCSGVGGGVGTATAITTSAQVCRAMSTGTLRVRPPSPSVRPSICTGAKTPGTDMLARMARARSPSASTTISPFIMSVAIARNGIGRWSKSEVPRLRATRSRMVCSTYWELMKAVGAATAPSRKPNSSELL